MTRLLLLLLFVLLAPVTGQAGAAEQSLTRANAKVRSAVLHDVCEVHGDEKRDQLDAEDRAAYALILKELQRSLDAKRRPGGGDADILPAWPAKALGANHRRS